MNGLRAVTVALLLVAASAGCETIDDLLGRGGGSAGDTLRLQSIAIVSDHPVDPLTPSGPAVATSAGVVRFTATGTFLNLDNDETLTRDVSSAVLWKSTAPAIAQPGSDGRAAVGSAGTTTVTAASPAAGDIPAFESNAITLTVP